MTTAILHQPTTIPPPITVPRWKRWTVAEFHRLWEEGWFENCRPVLLEGKFLEVPNPGPLHNMSTTLVDYQLKSLFGTGFVVRVQMPLVLSLWTDPVPDVAVVRGTPFDYPTNPTTAELVVEVADSSLSTDLGEKAALYAAAGISDYWVVDLVHRFLVVHQDPQVDASVPSQSRYRQVRTLNEASSCHPLAAPILSVLVGDLLPRPPASVGN